MKVLCYGSINIDLTYSVEHIVKEGETLSSLSLKKSAGGKGANQCAALAKAGLKTFHAGKIGEDGVFILKKLEKVVGPLACKVNSFVAPSLTGVGSLP